ncbi:MAG: SpoIIE family protein phosphatase [Flavobacteriales bacterium]|nr:SpoIIE family protein phosphatase [Flavobacteriales bacterium]
MNTVYGQSYDLEILDSESGIVGSQINGLTQDSHGYVWIATNSGVSRFDGKHFKNYHKKDGMAENHSSAILCDSDDHIWVGHQSGGISIFYGDSIVSITEKSGLANNEVHDIFQDRSGNIWIATFGGLSKFDGTNWSSMTTSDGLSSNNARCIAEDANGNIWVGTYGAGINILENGQVKSLSVVNGLVNNYVTDICAYRDQMMIGTLNGLSTWRSGRFHEPSFSNKLINSQINRISCNKNGDLWLGTFNGATRVRNETVFNLTEANGLTSNEVLSILNDREGNTWLGTRKGLVRIKNLAFAHFFSSDDEEIEPTCIFKDSKGTIWVGNESGGVLKFDGSRFVKAFADPDINDRQISSIGEDGDGNLWFGTMDFGGIFQWNGKKLYIYSDEFGLADNNINCLARDADGNLIIGTPSGLSIYDGMDFSMIPISDDPAENHITTLQTTSNGTVAIGTSDGSVFVLDGMSAEKIEGISASSPITDICESSYGLTIASQVDGIYFVKDGKIRHLDEGSGLRGSSLRSVAQLGKNLYVGTTQGLQQLWFIGDSLIVRTFDYSHGFLGKTCKRGSILSEGDNLWVGTTKGVTRFTTKERGDDLNEPLTFLTNIQLEQQDVNWEELGFETDSEGLPKNLVLDYTQNSLTFIFKGINHRQPEDVTYRCILEGNEHTWNPPSSQAFVSYPNLQPGKYTFKLVACNSANICNQNPITFSFEITPPFWRTWTFYIIFSLILLIATYLYILLRERRLKEEKRLLESTVEERTKELREQKEIVEGQNKHITESIDYARNIQMAVLPSEDELNRAFDDHFVFYRPKDVVGGDFYWVFVDGDITWAAAVDCTGHGVAGAFMSMIGTDLLNQIIIEKKVNDPAVVLDEMDKGIKLAFAQSAKEFETDQGMDMALVRIDRKKKVLEFAGAQRPLYLMQGGTLLHIEGNRHSISCAEQRGAEPFVKHTHKVHGNTVAYLFSDGIVDQFGGPNGKKFMIRRLRDFIEKNGSRSMKEQLAELSHEFDTWKGSDMMQVDDVMLLGIQL